MANFPKVDFGGAELQKMIDMTFGRMRVAVDPGRLLNDIRQQFGPETVDALAQYIRGPGGSAGASPGELDALREQVRLYAEAFQALKKQAAPYAVVTATRKDKVVINLGGKVIEAERGKHDGLRPGKTVKLTGDTLQILEAVDDAPAAGEVVSVTRVASKTLCEVERAGAARAVTYHGALEEGDRVVLDASGSVVVQNLGKPPNDCSLAEPTGVTWDDIGGLVEAKRQLREAIEAPTRHGATLARYGKKPIRGVLLYGAPGCGKTMLGKAAATALANLHGDAAAGAFFYVKGPALLSMYVGNTESAVRQLFAAARRHKKLRGHPAIIFIDEADAILGKRGMGLASLSGTVVPAFLAEMDGLQDSGALVLLATNRPGSLDPAIVRDGRIDRRIKIERPDRDAALDILARHLRTAPLLPSAEEAAQVAATALYDRSLVLYYVKKHSSVGRGVALTLGHVASGAMLAGVVSRATSIAMQREIDGGDAEGVTEADIRAAVAATFAEARDVNHADEIAEFCDGWEGDVAGVEKARPVMCSAEAN